LKYERVENDPAKGKLQNFAIRQPYNDRLPAVTDYGVGLQSRRPGGLGRPGRRCRKQGRQRSENDQDEQGNAFYMISLLQRFL